MNRFLWVSLDCCELAVSTPAFKRQHGVAPGSFRRLRRAERSFTPMMRAA